jgi:hypothetical protein
MPDPIEQYEAQVDLLIRMWVPAVKKLHVELTAAPDAFSDDDAVVLIEAMMNTNPMLVPTGVSNVPLAQPVA